MEVKGNSVVKFSGFIYLSEHLREKKKNENLDEKNCLFQEKILKASQLGLY